jgi:hypothetical protein
MEKYKELLGILKNFSIENYNFYNTYKNLVTYEKNNNVNIINNFTAIKNTLNNNSNIYINSTTNNTLSLANFYLKKNNKDYRREQIYLDLLDYIENIETFIKNYNHYNNHILPKINLIWPDYMSILNNNDLNKLIETINTNINKYNNTLQDITLKNNNNNSDIIRINTIINDCNIRRKEGYFINSSLYNLQEDIRYLIKQSIKTGDQMPIFFDNPVYPHCINNNLDDDVFEQFYDNNIKNKNINGFIFDTIKAYIGDNITKLNFIIMTIINTTDNEFINNPPKPPYININELYYYTNIKQYDDDGAKIEKLKYEIKKTLDTLKNYSFYRENVILPDIYNIAENFNNIGKNYLPKFKDDINELIKIISKNNAATLIGSLETTDMIQNLSYNKIVCSEKPFDNLKLSIKSDEFKNNTNLNDVNKGFNTITTSLNKFKLYNIYDYNFNKYKTKFISDKVYNKINNEYDIEDIDNDNNKINSIKVNSYNNNNNNKIKN